MANEEFKSIAASSDDTEHKLVGVIWHWLRAYRVAEAARREALLDRASYDSFPASDPVAPAASADPDGTLASYAWTWGDGTEAGSGASATHAYAAAGTYTVTLTVTDDDGDSSVVQQQVTVAPPAASPIAFRAVHPGSSCAALRLPPPPDVGGDA